MYRRYYNRYGQYTGYSYGGCLWLVAGLIKFLIIGALLAVALAWPLVFWHSWLSWIAECGWVLVLGSAAVARGDHGRRIGLTGDYLLSSDVMNVARLTAASASRLLPRIDRSAMTASRCDRRSF